VITPTFEWVDAGGRFRLAIMPRPDARQLEAHLVELKQKGMDVLVSMLEAEETVALGLGEERTLCEKVGIHFHNHPIPDHLTPTDRAATETFARALLEELGNGRGVVIHCFAGIGRSATMAAAVLMMAGFSLDEACSRLSAARNFRVPETPAQRDWLSLVKAE
jgi:protein-tyrosine phosphatase